ncbi:hypothetical protein Nepgr_003380 [Nepenthes gracilis]|uniref:Protein SIEVE ELEMENT OCCLUSION B-like n=1 Tax=Nepenthes gracilis TaxID=150966 RepID=A0AAD3RZE4_NEPGR|nr:hypothetical protein Nepgr_003380 [Nepenthes gracilis]
MASATVPARTSKFKGERHMFSTSDDNAMLNQIRATHAPDGREIDVKPLLQVIDDIFHLAAPTIPGTAEGTQAQTDMLDSKAFQSSFSDIMELLAYTISKISCEISCKCSGGGDAHATTLAVFNMLSSYSWDTKVVLVLAAFSVYYGEFWLVAQLYLTNPLAKSVAILKQLPEIMERSDYLKPKYEAISSLIRAGLSVTRCIVEFKDLPAQYITHDTPAYEAATSLIPTAAYWTIRSIVACASQIMGLLGMSHEYIASTTEAWEISSLAHKVGNIHDHLMKQLALCYHHIDEKKQMEAYQILVRLFETPQLDNMKILKALITTKEDQMALIDGSTKKTVSIEVLRRKNVLLLISDLELSHEELSILDQMYQESRQYPTRAESQYEVVWLPVDSTPWNETKQKQFEYLQSMMLWYSVPHPSLLDRAVIRYIKEVWHFNQKPLLVVLDTLGRVVNPNAIHMMWIWGSQAFPFTSAREEALWKEETWRIELLADTIEPLIFTWIQQNKYICLYGGEDMEWIRNITTRVKTVAQEAGIPLEMLYVGKSNLKEKVRKNNSIILAENLSHTLPDVTLTWFFWARLESMWHSKAQHGKSAENDAITQEIVTMLSFDGSDQGWAVISRGSAEIAKAKGDTILSCLNEFGKWKEEVGLIGFVQALNDHLQKLRTPHHCNRLILPGSTGNIPERVVCAECGRPMEKFLMYRCCTD